MSNIYTNYIFANTISQAVHVEMERFFPKKQEKEVNRKQEEQIKQAIIDNKDIVIDNTNIGKSRKHLIDILRKHKYYIIGVNIKTPYEICYKRRKDCIPEKTMKQMNDGMEFMTNKDCDKIINVEYNKI